MLNQITGLHIEPTNMCTLKCPRCSRTTFLEKFKIKNWENQNLNLNHLRKFLDIDLNGLTISLNGNYGDPIYHPNFIELVNFFKTNGASVIIQTNGSYQLPAWWDELSKVLDSNDIINFSIDGIPTNFTNYRINADWPTIKQGIDIMVNSAAKVVWRYIVFSFNESTIDEARELSQLLKMDDFVVINSDRWIENDWLKPSEYIKIDDQPGSRFLYNGSYVGGKDRSLILWHKNHDELQVDPICKKTNNMHFISATGFYSPCCWIADHRFYYKSEFYKNKDLYDISKTTLSEILLKPDIVEFFDTIETAKPKYCTFNCGTL